MSFIKELKIASIVVVARNFNPSIFTQQWLVSRGVLNKDSSEGQQIFTPQFVHVTNNHFRLTVLPEQLIFEVVNSPKETFVQCANEKLKPMLDALGETPFVAVGVNFQWRIADEEKSAAAVSKYLFNKDGGIYSEFNALDARYGAYMSKNFLDSRLNLDIRPAVEQQNDQPPKEFIISAFNFHKDLFLAEKHTELLSVIGNCNSFLQESEKILMAL